MTSEASLTSNCYFVIFLAPIKLIKLLRPSLNCRVVKKNFFLIESLPLRCSMALRKHIRNFFCHNGRRNLQFWTKIEIKNRRGFWLYHSLSPGNQNTIITMHSVLLYDKYFSSKCKKSVFFGSFCRNPLKRYLFYNNFKSICHRTKPSTWLWSHFYYGEMEYNIMKIRDENFLNFGPKSQISTAIMAEKISA